MDKNIVNPYRKLSDYQFWRRSITNIEKHEFDPVVTTKFNIGVTDKIATAGSCFAQHISSALQKNGFEYLVCDDEECKDEDERKKRQFGIFSARFGNIYTARQLRQLLQAALAARNSKKNAWNRVLRAISMKQCYQENAWVRKDGQFVDPYRPTIEPDGYSSEIDVVNAREKLFQSVLKMVDEATIFIFTLGLTEAWRSRIDGSVFPLAPGVAAGSFNPEKHEFINFKVNEVIQDLEEVIQLLKKTNPSLRIILTVSPVPLIATYEDRNVLVSTTYSKSVLRVAAEEITHKYEHVDYFPSYEIITGNYNCSTYYENDFREVRPIGVAHVMRIFLRHYTSQPDAQPSESQTNVDIGQQYDQGRDIICDEEEIEQSLSQE